jgi:hypothetical protein
MDDFEAFALRKAAHSRAAFGPKQTDEGILDHLTKEMDELRAAERPGDKRREWVDIFMLGLDGLMRSFLREGYTTARSAAEAVHAIRTKQTELEMREWPDWRTIDADKAIEHVKPQIRPSDKDLDFYMANVSHRTPVGSRFIHQKSQNTYQVVGHCFIEATSEPGVLYALDGRIEARIWCRPASEFLDGRFEARDGAAEPSTDGRQSSGAPSADQPEGRPDGRTE